MLLIGALAVSPADACCHLYGNDWDAGPCVAGWRGDLVFTSENRVDWAYASCTVGNVTVGGEHGEP